MRVQATKKMANELNKAIKGTRFEEIMRFDARQFPYDYYTFYVSNNHSDAGADYDTRTGNYRTIRVDYSDYTAIPQYITTRDLTRIFKTTGNNWDDFVKEVCEQYEV